MTGSGPSALWIRRTVLAALPALLARPAVAKAATPAPPPRSAPVVLLLGGQDLAAAWTPALLEAGCAPLGPVDPADLADALAWARTLPNAPRLMMMGPAELVDAQTPPDDLALLIRLAPARAPLSGRAVLAALSAWMTDDPLSKAHAVFVAAEGPAGPGRADIPTLTLTPEAGPEPLKVALARLDRGVA